MESPQRATGNAVRPVEPVSERAIDEPGKEPEIEGLMAPAASSIPLLKSSLPVWVQVLLGIIVFVLAITYAGWFLHHHGPPVHF